MDKDGRGLLQLLVRRQKLEFVSQEDGGNEPIHLDEREVATQTEMASSAKVGNQDQWAVRIGTYSGMFVLSAYLIHMFIHESSSLLGLEPTLRTVTIRILAEHVFISM